MENFRMLWRNIQYSFLKPVKSPYFWLYFIVLIVIIGSFGIWILWVDSFKDTYKGGDFNLAIISFSIVLFVSAGVDILLKENNNKNGLNIIGILLLLLPLGTMFTTFLIVENWYSYTYSVMIYLLSLFSWWVANGDKELFEEKIVDLQEQVSKAKPRR